jgi:hypothetical protein
MGVKGKQLVRDCLKIPRLFGLTDCKFLESKNHNYWEGLGNFRVTQIAQVKRNFTDSIILANERRIKLYSLCN